MGKGSNQNLLQNSGTANKRSGTLTSNANDLYGFLDPTLQSEATNPTGYAPGDLAAMNTASQQSLGGATSAVTGQSNLEAARSRNAGGFQGAIGSGSRSAMKDNAQNAVQVQAQNAALKEAQKQQALSSLQNLYGTDESTALGYLNSSNSANSAESQSHPLQGAFGVGAQWINAMANAAKAAQGADSGGGDGG